ncbi:MAG: hypothetical protein A2X49_00935 [Lentisphaerae bacterium GWF2_52_8]|nr:MAG: hypothetical protein A2X49_00935 [Lentisphaerae bacterium GWF2_52_8]
MNELTLDLTRKYSEPWRRYHNLLHIAKMFSDAAKYGIRLSEKQEWAIWFHDAIYVPGKKDNELESAAFAAERLHELNWAYPDINEVREIILSSSDHIPRSEESKAVIDLDLLPLADEELYWRNIALIRKEYRSLSECQWIEGRTAWLNKFLARKNVYTTELFINSAMEEIARQNLQKELSEIEKTKKPL